MNLLTAAKYLVCQWISSRLRISRVLGRLSVTPVTLPTPETWYIWAGCWLSHDLIQAPVETPQPSENQSPSSWKALGAVLGWRLRMLRGVFKGSGSGFQGLQK